MASIMRPSGIRDLSPSRRVLIVDDNIDSADMAAELLRERGHDARVAYSPRAALELAAGFQPQIALLDLDLPNMSGYELANQLRARPGLATCRFVALTGNAYEVDRRNSQAAGFYGHLTKPFGAQALFDVVSGEDDASSTPPTGSTVG